MTPDDALKVADETLFASTGNRLKDIQRLILLESLADKGYEEMKGYDSQHFKNEGKALWDLLSKALGEKVSKTNFKGALEKRWKLGELVLTSPQLLNYNPQTWVGRKAVIDESLLKLQDQTRVVWISGISGISGIGKTVLGECLASYAWEVDPSFQWLYLEILEGQSREFVSVAADLLATLGDIALDPHERNDPKRLMERLLRKLQANRYWIQVDSLERLLDPEKSTETEFADSYWVTFLQRCLTEPSFVSRLVLTTQALPTALAEFEDRYSNFWQLITLQGLSANLQDDQQLNEHLELFTKNGLSIDDLSSTHLQRIGKIYEGHPLALQVIAKEILASPFYGNVESYWERYGDEFEQDAREQQDVRVRPELFNQALQKRVRRRVEISLRRLPTDAFELLCRSSVYRRPVPETFWLALLDESASEQRTQAYQILNERVLVEREGIHQKQFLIRQHNLVRAVAYDLLKANETIWEQSERQAANLWLTIYEPAPDVPNLETVRGNLEAFAHYCQLKDWESAKTILLDQQIGLRLQTWGDYLEMLTCHSRLLGHLQLSDEVACQRGLGSAYFLLGNYPQAILHFQQGLDLAREIGDHQSEGVALGNLGNVYNSTGQYKKAIGFHTQSLTIAREIGDRKGEGRSLCNLGIAYRQIGEYERAIDIYQESLTLAHEIGDRKGEGDALGNLGIAYRQIGQYERAIDFYQESLTIAHETGNRRDEEDALCNLGNVYNSLRQYERAIDFFHQALTIAREIKDRQGEGITLGNLGNAYDGLGQYEQAIDFHQRQLTLVREIGDRLGEGISLGNLGHAYNCLEQHERAIDFFHQYLRIAREIGFRHGEGKALGNLGNARYSLGQYEQAIDFFQQHLTLVRETGDQQGEGIALINLGGTQLKLKHYSESLIHNEWALEIFQEICMREGEAEALKNLAELHQALGEVEVARQYGRQALALATELGIPLSAECEALLQTLESNNEEQQI